MASGMDSRYHQTHQLISRIQKIAAHGTEEHTEHMAQHLSYRVA